MSRAPISETDKPRDARERRNEMCLQFILFPKDRQYYRYIPDYTSNKKYA